MNFYVVSLVYVTFVDSGRSLQSFKIIPCKGGLTKGCHDEQQRQHIASFRGSVAGWTVQNVFVQRYFCVLRMANNILSNGRIQQQMTVSQRSRSDKGKKGVLLYSYELCKIFAHIASTRASTHSVYNVQKFIDVVRLELYWNRNW